MKKIILIEDLGMLFPNYTSKKKSHYGIFKCYCGNLFKSHFATVKSGKCSSCGCHKMKMISLSNTTHGLSNHKLYDTWRQILQRTTNKSNKDYVYYGARGIKACDRWLKIENFIEDMFTSYKDGLSIDRINNNGNYEPKNCRWVEHSTQTRNSVKIRKSNTSGYRGVSKSGKKWMANIFLNKSIYLGTYIDKESAAKAYDDYVIKNNLEHTLNFGVSVL